jgi:hypothetical protein
MSEKILMFFLYFFNYYNEALYKPVIYSYTKKPNYFYLVKSNPYRDKNSIYPLNNNDSEKNDLEIDTITKPFNKNSRLGRTKDQDGKSNIWSVEPNMEVVDEEISEINKIILTSGLIITGCLFALPLLYTLNQYIQKIDY